MGPASPELPAGPTRPEDRRPMRAIIFAGPTLPPAVRPVSGPAIEWRPPVRQGDVYRAALSGPSVIGIVDGYFEGVPTGWHKEILWAMAQGIHVFGAASIGALRAAELDVFGMRGIGLIYEAFRDGVLEDDDEVAVLHGPEELGYPPLTEAMVNIRATSDEAVRAGVLAPDLAAQLTEIAKSLFYKERTNDLIYEAFRDGVLEDDDEVAVLHGPEELGYPPLTEAMVKGG